MMSRHSIADLKRPLPGYRADKVLPATGKQAFETKVQAWAEDALRAKSLRRYAKEEENDERRMQAQCLAQRLERGVETGSPPPTLASKAYLREHRLGVSGHLRMLIEEVPCRTTTFTLLPNDGPVDSDSLVTSSANHFMQSLRSNLNRAGATEASGFIFACLHGEFDVTTGLYHRHFHLSVGGDMIGVVNNLRDIDKYKLPEEARSGKGKRRPPVRECLKPLKHPLHALTYVVQSYWPHRPSVILEDGTMKRSGRRYRIPEPYQSQLLLWLDQWRLQDITLLMGLRVTRDGFLPTKL